MANFEVSRAGALPPAADALPKRPDGKRKKKASAKPGATPAAAQPASERGEPGSTRRPLDLLA
jgi:hypothetical protein